MENIVSAIFSDQNEAYRAYSEIKSDLVNDTNKSHYTKSTANILEQYFFYYCIFSLATSTNYVRLKTVILNVKFMIGIKNIHYTI